jgi:signal transduction histidine kinase
MILKTDAEGKLSVSDYKGIDQKFVDILLSMHLVNDVLQEESSYVQVNGSYMESHQFKNMVKLPANLTVIYASKAADYYKNGTYYYDYDMDSTWNFLDSGFGYVFATALFAIFIFAMILPFVRYLGIGRGFSTRIPLEVSVAFMGASMANFEDFAYVAWNSVSNGFVFDTDVTVFTVEIQKIITYGANVLLWMLFLSIWYLGLLSMRQVFSLGLIRYIREKTLTGRFISWCIRKTKAYMVALREVDLQDKTNKNIIKILLINYVVLSIISLFWVFGIVILIPYTITVFFIIRKYLTDLKLQYNTLLEATSKIADGNLEVIIDGNLGVFEPIKEELSKIQQGFAKAVREETKSERMKTELITNVSHDLKTPLTAIITYVDLLKREETTEEDRKSYIETLDMKSQRLKRLIEDLFEVSKASSNNITLNLVEVDLANLIKQVVLELDYKIKAAEIEIRLNLPENKVILSLDSEKTYRIFENLIINITKYALPHTRAYIDMSVNEELVIVAVKNVSAGELNFSPEEITERFVRGDLSRNSEGSGLGLAITKSFVELQNGKFTIVADGDLFKAIIEWRMK